MDLGARGSWWLNQWWLVVEPTHLQNMLVKVDHFPNFRVNIQKIFETTKRKGNPPIAGLISGDYQGTMMVNNPLMRPYFLGGGIGRVPLDSHEQSLVKTPCEKS